MGSRVFSPSTFRSFHLAVTVFSTAMATLCLGLPVSASVRADLPDYYSEPGTKPQRDPTALTPNEVIDTFSGGLQLRHVDLYIPGDGGFGLTIQRVYNSNNVYKSRSDAGAPYPNSLLARSPFGMGWSMHFGRVLRSSSTPSPCDNTGTADTLDNPILELPDGSQQILFNNNSGLSGPIFITQNQWVATCIAPSAGLLVISPDGTQYTMNHREGGGQTYDADTDYAWYTTKIVDRNGNTINITYTENGQTGGVSPVPGSYAALPQTVTLNSSSGNKTVTFTYRNVDTEAPPMPVLDHITFNSRTWSYQVTKITDYPSTTASSPGYYQLTQVTLPDSRYLWKYTYWSKSGFPSLSAAGHRNLQQVTYPFGATVNYDYNYACLGSSSTANWTCSASYNTFYTLVVKSKTTGGTGVTAGTWNYSYSPTSTDDTTTVTFPGGQEIYKHYGFRSILSSSNPTIGGANLWKIGLLKEKQSYNNSTLIKDEVYTWATDTTHPLSTENYIRPPFTGSDTVFLKYWDTAVYLPILQSRVVTLDGTQYSTTYSNFITSDASFNPQTVAETGQASRTTTLTYYSRTAAQNIVRLVKDETYSGELQGKNIYRTFDPRGNPTQVTLHGVVDNYAYYPNGNVNTHTNANSKVWTYTSYVCGIAQSESLPEGVTVSRVVDPNYCNVTSETNGNHYATGFTYDNLDRVASITRPLGDAIGVTWNPVNVRTVTRGTYSRATTYDGFGKVIGINTNGITQTFNYNELGFKKFQSYLGTTSGDSITPDVLGRVTGVSHPDSTSRTIQYLSGNRELITNERSYQTTRTYRSFGDPERAADKALTRIDAQDTPTTVITTYLVPNVLGQMTSVTQGGYARGYGYDQNTNFLLTENNPEFGLITYGRDGGGNMTSRQVGTSGTTIFTYDGLSRLRYVQYPTGSAAPNVTLGYDNNSNLTSVDNGTAQRIYSFDANDNMYNESLAVGGLTLNAAYGFNTRDQLNTITYPSGWVVTYNPDPLGRPTDVLPITSTPNGVVNWANGVPNTINFVNGQVTTQLLNSRQWLNSILTQKPGAALVSLGYGYDGLANVTGITNNMDATDSKTMSYDGVDRLLGTTSSGGNTSMGYDAADNITSMTTSAGSLGYQYIGDQLTGTTGYKSLSVAYDTYGNVSGYGGNTYVYDDAANLRSVSGGATASYDYDGKNTRVRTVANGQTSYFFYANHGNLLGEYYPPGLWKKEYVYLGAKLVATASDDPDAPPSILTPTLHSNGSFTISWAAATGGVTAYEVYQSTSSNFATKTLVYNGSNTSFTLSGLAPGTYYYEVRACNDTTCSSYTVAAVSTSVIAPDGDLNGDGVVDVADVLLAERIALGLVVPTATQLAHADAAPAGAPDNVIDVSDVARIRRKALGLETF